MRNKNWVEIFCALAFTAIGSKYVFADSVPLNYDYPDGSNDVEVGIGVDDSLAIASSATECIAKDVKINATTSCSHRIGGTSNNPLGFTITISDKDNETALTKEKSSATIPAIDGELKAGDGGWNITGGLFTNKAITTGQQKFLETSDVGVLDTEVTYNFATSSIQEWGSYEDTIVYTITDNSTATYGITYDANGGTVEKTSDIVNYNEDVDLPTPKMDGMTFAGWKNGSSVFYRTTNPNPRNLYRVELKADYKKTIFNISTMQEMTPQICKATTTPSKTAVNFDTDGSHFGDTSYVPSVTLTDARDNSRYLVRKLADGECWMTDELNLKLTAGEPIATGNGKMFVPKNSTQAKTGTKWETTDITAQRSYSDGTRGYYNKAAAFAGSSDYSDSICPTNWQIPASEDTKKNKKSFSNLLLNAYGYNPRTDARKALDSPVFNFKPGGYYDSYRGFLQDVGEDTDASTGGSSSSKYYAYKQSLAVYNYFGIGDMIYGIAGVGENAGIMIRCVAK